MVKKNIFSILVALVIMYLSLTGSETFEKVSFNDIPFIDKVAHFGMYFLLMSVIVFENRKTLKSYAHLYLIALIPLFYGILMELLQSILTVSRSGSFFDIVFNSAGILVSLLIWLWIKPLTITK
ncbi:MAG: VanZ family protein [Bacteroidia bacterium]|nr:VanZ family protein [Bacteroidia bacterium]